MGGVGLVHGLWAGECVGAIPAPLAYRTSLSTGVASVPLVSSYCNTEFHKLSSSRSRVFHVYSS